MRREDQSSYALTSKGLLWFDRKKLSLKLRKDESFRALPAALQIDPDTWNAETAYQAFTLKRYYDCAVHSDYLLFPLPDDCNVLLGCEVSSATELHYCLTWIDSFNRNGSLRTYLRALISAEPAIRVTIVCALETQTAEITNFVRGVSAEGRIELFCLEGHAK